jgi:hypothetical protein
MYFIVEGTDRADVDRCAKSFAHATWPIGRASASW